MLTLMNWSLLPVAITGTRSCTAMQVMGDLCARDWTFGVLCVMRMSHIRSVPLAQALSSSLPPPDCR